MTVPVVLGILGLGAIGSIARAGVQALALPRERIPFFAGTLIVNLSGAFAIGVLHGAGVHGTGLKLAGAAFLGAFTTFSGWMLEVERLHGRSRWLAASYLVGSLTAGIALAWLGHALAG